MSKSLNKFFFKWLRFLEEDKGKIKKVYIVSKSEKVLKILDLKYVFFSINTGI